METKRWKVMIADDEPKIRRGLRSLLERMALPIEVCAEAGDGETALGEVEKHRPDILLVDINMPFMNGLEFIERIRRTRADARIIVISGYEEFSYVQQAISLDVHAYLLKPIENEELERTLTEAIERLETDRARNHHFEWAIARIGESRESLQESFLRDAVSGRLSPEEIRDFQVYFHFPEPVRMMLSVFSIRGADSEKPWQFLMRLYFLKNVLAESHADLRYYFLFPDDQGNILLLYDADTPADDLLIKRLTHALETETGAQVSTSTEPLDALTHISEAYDAASERLYGEADRSPVVAEAVRYIAENFQNPDLDLARVADALRIHPVYLSRLMKQELGMPFARYLVSIRISKAIKMMRDPKLRIWQIAEMVGYSGANYFSTAFKKVLGVSPAEYRAEDKSR